MKRDGGIRGGAYFFVLKQGRMANYHFLKFEFHPLSVKLLPVPKKLPKNAAELNLLCCRLHKKLNKLLSTSESSLSYDVFSLI